MQKRRRNKENELWAITAFFNPGSFRARVENYRIFRENLDLPLVTVEAAFPGQKFVLREGDAEILIQHQTRDILWQKERLLNLALEALPPFCTAVAWLDADVVFENPEWSQEVIKMLSDYPVIHPYSEVIEQLKETGKGSLAGSQKEGISFMESDGALLAHDMRTKRVYSGLAWVARREVLASTGLYDGCILGSGNRAILCAQMGDFESAVEYLEMNDLWEAHYRSWAEKHYAWVQGKIGLLKGKIRHLWHGDLKLRQYKERHKKLKEFRFSPQRDLALDKNGCWQWNSSKPEMHSMIRKYFQERKEDG